MPEAITATVRFRLPGYALSTARQELEAAAEHWIRAWSDRGQGVFCKVRTAGSLWTVTISSQFGLTPAALSLVYFAAAEIFGYVLLAPNAISQA